jgi:type I restriction enzyme M protein
MPITDKLLNWYKSQIETLDPKCKVAKIDADAGLVIYSPDIQSDEALQRPVTPEEMVHALALCMLASPEFKYPISKLYHEKRYAHGSKGSLSDEVDILVSDPDDLPFALWELKSAEEYERERADAIKNQLFGTAPLVGAPKFLVCATIKPFTKKPAFSLVCIDYTKQKSHDTWIEAGQPHTSAFPPDYQDPKYQPYTNGGPLDMRLDATQSEFRAAATIFHNEFFGEHPDNMLYINLVKCLLAKILDERNTKRGDTYSFQTLQKSGREESAADTFARVNALYKTAYTRYIDPSAPDPDEINPKEFPADRVKTVVKTLQGMSITRGAALHADVIGAFFEEILRVGFKQDKGMYFTHANLVHFMLEAADVGGLAVSVWQRANHPDNRLPYVIDPACGSGTFLLKAMQIITQTIDAKKDALVADFESEQFYAARMSPPNPNYWAEHFLYGLDPKFIMAITAKVNMVLHGDGSAHIFKQDAFKGFSMFANSRFRPAGDSNRSIPRTRYKPDLCESFDLVVSNPPFGIKLASDTKAVIPRHFTLKTSCPSEALFLERAFQLLKPNGRLALVLPESLFNTVDSLETRLLLYRCFWIRAIVALPRNVFIDTPTLTSLLFAQKKTPDELQAWDSEWAKRTSEAEARVKRATAFLRKAKKEGDHNVSQIQEQFLKLVHPVVTPDCWIPKKGKNADVASAIVPTSITTGPDAIAYYADFLKLAGIRRLVARYAFAKAAARFDYEYPVYRVDEVGYKLSKRREKIRPNQLCKFVGQDSGEECPNLHLAHEPLTLSISVDSPERVLDFIKRDISWR